MAEKQTTGAGRDRARTRREGVRKALAPSRPRRLEPLRRPAAVKGLLVALGFALASGAIVAAARERVLPAAGRTALRSVAARVEFSIPDEAATERARQRARDATPRVYTADPQVFEEIQRAVEQLPAALADAPTLGDVAEEVRKAWPLTEERLAAVRAHALDGAPSPAWRDRAKALAQLLRETPFVAADVYQREMQEPGGFIELRVAGTAPLIVAKQAMVNVEGAQLKATAAQLVRDAGFVEPAAGLIAQWLAARAEPTYFFDAKTTAQAQDDAAAAVPVQTRTFRAGQLLVARGQIVSAEMVQLLAAERRAFAQQRPGEVWLHRLGALLTALALTIGMTAYAARFSGRIRRNPLRALALALLTLAALWAGAWTVVAAPSLLWLGATAPAIFLAFLLSAAYDQRLALGLAGLFALLLAAAVDAPLLLLPAALAGVGACVWRLGEIRERGALVQAGGAAGLAAALATLAVGLALRPVNDSLWVEMGADALWTLGGSVAAGMLTLGALPSIEKLFGVTTGLTLIELRDPRQPLLRELQRRAPGTYNHSLTVATIAEAAAEAIGADALHLYAGALYHDVGKMHKPDYFIENQTPGASRHANLPPSMSLLVIVGHVKDGLELAREYNLPRSLHHYIESHHGTTLVEYFYHQAKKQAEKVEEYAPEDVEYRYPGPKPRTKEAAILMLADAVESAARTMKDPSPKRIEALVHELAMKRLLDGQFDECDLTLRELHTVEASMVKSLNSIHHARIAYPAGEEAPQRDGQADRQSDRKTPQAAAS